MIENDNATATFRLSGVFYIEFLNALHTHLTPRSYLEVGTSKGTSLAVAGCDTIAVDPRFAIPAGATGDRRRTFFFQMTSDDFFATENAPALLGRQVDMAFLDGLHRFEYLLRDFIGAEAACHPGSLILLHDCVPSNTRMALRQFQPGDSSEEGNAANWWTGDVWKLLPILREYRPDLRLHVLDCHPTGLVAITRLDPASSVLADRYHEIVDQHAESVLDEDGLRSFRDNLELTASRPLYEQPDRLTELFTRYTPRSGMASVSNDIKDAQPIFHRQRDAIEAHLTILFTALAVSHAIQSRTGLAIANLVKQRRPLRSATITINGAAQSFPPEIPTPQRKILAGLGIADPGY